MQSYPLNLAAGAAQTFSVSARRFVYESGMGTPEGSDSRIIVKPDSGGEVVMRPGQSIGLEAGQLAANWYVRGFDPAVPIRGMVIIGSGEFEDNSLKVDATSGAITVVPQGGFRIYNDDTQRVPVTLDLSQVLKVESPIVKYTNSYSNPAYVVSSQGAFRELVAPSANTKGVILEQALSSAAWSALAKASAPTKPMDGDVLCADTSKYLIGTRFFVPPGKGLYLWANGDSWVSALWTVL